MVFRFVACGYLVFQKNFIFYHILLMFEHSCLYFHNTTFLHPIYSHLPPSILALFGFVHGSFIHVPWQPLPFFPLLFPSPSPLVTVSLFLISIFDLICISLMVNNGRCLLYVIKFKKLWYTCLQYRDGVTCLMARTRLEAYRRPWVFPSEGFPQKPL